MTPAKVLEAKTAKTAAKRLAELIKETFPDQVKNLFVWSPEETKSRGWGSGWAVCWEEGMYDWTAITAGSSIYAGESGRYSQPGWFPEGLRGSNWYAEPYNGFVINFYQD